MARPTIRDFKMVCVLGGRVQRILFERSAAEMARFFHRWVLCSGIERPI